jgi:tetratricopeptide (TPR) repeat protein
MPTIKKRSKGVKIQQEQEIVTLAHKVSHLMEGYRKPLQLAAVVIAVVIVLYAGYSIVRARQDEKAAPLVAVAYEYFNPSSAGMSADTRKALELFREIQKQYPNTQSGAIAQYYIGNCLMNLGRPEDALKEYQAFVSKYSGDKTLLGLVYQRMAYAYRGLGRQDEARNAFEKSESLTGPGIATIELARMYESMGHMAESQKKYKTILDNLGGTSWGMEAMSKVQKIESAPKPVEGKAGK